MPRAEIQDEIDPVHRKLFEKPWEKHNSDKSQLEEEQLPETIQELVSEVINLKSLLEETMDVNQKLQDRVKYLENKYTKGKKKITFENKIVEISSDSDDESGNEGEEPARNTREPTPSMLEYEQITDIKQRVGKLSNELKDATKYAKISEQQTCNRKDTE